MASAAIATRLPTIVILNQATPTPTIRMNWTSAISSRMITFEPISCQRLSGVAASRLRISFWRSATSGIAAKIPVCMRAIPRMLGTRYETAFSRSVWIGLGWLVIATGRPPRLTIARVPLTYDTIAPDELCWLGST